MPEESDPKHDLNFTKPLNFFEFDRSVAFLLTLKTEACSKGNKNILQDIGSTINCSITALYRLFSWYDIVCVCVLVCPVIF